MSESAFKPGMRLPVLADIAHVAAQVESADLRCVVVGGAVIPLYLGESGRSTARGTEDVDVVVDS